MEKKEGHVEEQTIVCLLRNQHLLLNLDHILKFVRELTATQSTVPSTLDSTELRGTVVLYCGFSGPCSLVVVFISERAGSGLTLKNWVTKTYAITTLNVERTEKTDIVAALVQIQRI